MMQKEQQQAKLKGDIFRVVTIDTTNKGSRPEIHDTVGGGKRLDYRIFLGCVGFTVPYRGSPARHH